MANLFDPPGTPLGTAHHAERDRIRAHLRRRIWRFHFGPGISVAHRLESRVGAIQRRLHKYDPTLRERQAIARAKAPPPAATDVAFTWEELERLVEHFAGANDPVTAAIAAKAAASLTRAPNRP